MKKRTATVLALFILIILISCARVVASVSLSTSGIDLEKLQSETLNINYQNTLLREKLYDMTSLTAIAAKAREEGFEDSSKSVMIAAPIPVAYKQ